MDLFPPVIGPENSPSDSDFWVANVLRKFPDFSVSLISAATPQLKDYGLEQQMIVPLMLAAPWSGQPAVKVGYYVVNLDELHLSEEYIDGLGLMVALRIIEVSPSVSPNLPDAAILLSRNTAAAILDAPNNQALSEKALKIFIEEIGLVKIEEVIRQPIENVDELINKFELAEVGLLGGDLLILLDQNLITETPAVRKACQAFYEEDFLETDLQPILADVLAGELLNRHDGQDLELYSELRQASDAEEDLMIEEFLQSLAVLRKELKPRAELLIGNVEKAMTSLRTLLPADNLGPLTKILRNYEKYYRVFEQASTDGNLCSRFYEEYTALMDYIDCQSELNAKFDQFYLEQDRSNTVSQFLADAQKDIEMLVRVSNLMGYQYLGSFYLFGKSKFTPDLSALEVEI